MRWKTQGVPATAIRVVGGWILLIAVVIGPAVWLKREPRDLIVLAGLATLALAMILRWTIQEPIQNAARYLRELRLGRTQRAADLPQTDLLAPLADEVHLFARSLQDARVSAETEAQLRHANESIWTPERLKEHVRRRLDDRLFIVISNREPYIHQRKNGGVEWSVPPSGLVTALEPVLRACGGLWIAQGTGSADRETVDDKNHIQVPPNDPRYTLRRVWVTEAENTGFYDGFSNEGLWPLCHIAHTRPLFRPEDWAAYVSVNERFAQTALEEMEGHQDPLVLVQDYHFALVPLLIKQQRPDARVALFWHIPWPNPEAFGICPWRRQLLVGMLGADLIGFHIQQHCNNFLDSVDRTLEARIDWERFSVLRRGHIAAVKPFPISVAMSPFLEESETAPALSAQAMARDRAALGIRANHVAIGVDRIDYTKGLVERFRAIERFLEDHPSYIGNFVLLELAAPSRTTIARYSEFVKEVQAEAARINARFRKGDWEPILLREMVHTHEAIHAAYRLADVCLVTSLHDGMNLVAKEYVAAREDGDGVLILSPFAGASRELRDAIIANPYDVTQLAGALAQALEMPVEQRRDRMRRMRHIVRENNIYTWASRLVTDLAQVRVESPSGASTGGAVTTTPFNPAANADRGVVGLAGRASFVSM